MLEFLFIKAAGLKVCTSIKNRLQRRCFPVKFANFLRTPSLQNSFGGYFCGLNGIFKGLQNKSRCDCQQ